MALMSSHCLLAILIIIVHLAAAAERQDPLAPFSGNEIEWQPILVIGMEKMAKFAVSEYNKESGKKMMLKSLIGGFQKAVPPVGQLWRLYIVVKDTKSEGTYEIIVYDPFPTGSNWQLVSFKQVKK